LLIFNIFFFTFSFSANDIKSMDDLSDLLNECNSPDFNKLIPNIVNRIKLRRHFHEYVCFFPSLLFLYFIIIIKL